MSKQLYNILKAIAQIWLPALGTLIFALGDIWHFSWDTQVVGSIMAVDAFLGVGLRLARSSTVFDGSIMLNMRGPEDGKLKFDITRPLEDIPARKELRLKLEPPGEVPEEAPVS
jgi:Putative phage holin Dp-1